jgi:hypothetical protein
MVYQKLKGNDMRYMYIQKIAKTHMIDIEPNMLRLSVPSRRMVDHGASGMMTGRGDKNFLS